MSNLGSQSFRGIKIKSRINFNDDQCLVDSIALLSNVEFQELKNIHWGVFQRILSKRFISVHDLPDLIGVHGFIELASKEAPALSNLTNVLQKGSAMSLAP